MLLECIGPLGTLLDPDVAAPQVEHHVAVTVTAEILGGDM